MKTRNSKILAIYKSGKTLEEIGGRFGFSRSRAQQIVIKGLKADILKRLKLKKLTEDERVLLDIAVKEEIQAAALLVVLYCKGFSEGKTGTATVEREKGERMIFKGSWMPGEYDYPFEFVAPPGPRTYKGHVFDVTWHLGAKARTSQEKDRDISDEEGIILLSQMRMPQDREVTGSNEVVHRQSPRSLIGCFSFSLIILFVGIYVSWRYSPFSEMDDDVRY